MISIIPGPRNGEHSKASLEECRYYLILTRDLGYGETDYLARFLEEISRMLEAYIRAMTKTDQ